MSTATVKIFYLEIGIDNSVPLVQFGVVIDIFMYTYIFFINKYCNLTMYREKSDILNMFGAKRYGIRPIYINFFYFCLFYFLMDSVFLVFLSCNVIFD
jgi:hypothetical protein